MKTACMWAAYVIICVCYGSCKGDEHLIGSWRHAVSPASDRSGETALCSSDASLSEIAAQLHLTESVAACGSCRMRSRDFHEHRVDALGFRHFVRAVESAGAGR